MLVGRAILVAILEIERSEIREQRPHAIVHVRNVHDVAVDIDKTTRESSVAVYRKRKRDTYIADFATRCFLIAITSC